MQITRKPHLLLLHYHVRHNLNKITMNLQNIPGGMNKKKIDNITRRTMMQHIQTHAPTQKHDIFGCVFVALFGCTSLHVTHQKSIVFLFIFINVYRVIVRASHLHHPPLHTLYIYNIHTYIRYIGLIYYFGKNKYYGTQHFAEK